MAAVPVTITGVLADKYGRTIQVVTLFGDMVRSDVGIGGGPIIPPPSGGGGGEGIWGPTDPRPTPPIANVPGIDNPDPPGELPPDPGTGEQVTVLKAPPEGGGWGAVTQYGWAYYPGPNQAQPKR